MFGEALLFLTVRAVKGLQGILEATLSVLGHPGKCLSQGVPCSLPS